MLGHRRAAVGWALGELAGIAAVAYLAAGLASSSWYLLPFLAGVAFIGAWAAQAVDAYRQAEEPDDIIGPARDRSPAAALAWLSIPLLVWATGFWMVSADASSPSAVLDRFETAWPGLATTTAGDSRLQLSAASTEAARTALDRLAQLCSAGQLTSDCGATRANLLRDVRLTVTSVQSENVTAVAQVVTFERRPSRFLFVFAGTDLVPVAKETALTLDLQAVPALLPGGIDIGARHWQIVNADAG